MISGLNLSNSKKSFKSLALSYFYVSLFIFACCAFSYSSDYNSVGMSDNSTSTASSILKLVILSAYLAYSCSYPMCMTYYSSSSVGSRYGAAASSGMIPGRLWLFLRRSGLQLSFRKGQFSKFCTYASSMSLSIGLFRLTISFSLYPNDAANYNLLQRYPISL